MVKNIYKDKDIIVFGGCGSIGSELVKQLIEFKPKRIRVFDNRESGHFHLNQKLKSPLIRNLIGDIKDRDRVFRAMEKVDICFNAAALKHVDLCEYNPFEAVNVNVIGTQNVLEASIDRDIKILIGISTDKAVSPICTMGATKLLSEKIIINAPSGFSKIKLGVVRFGNVLNSDGSVIPIFKNQIANGGPITITDMKMIRFCMTIDEAVKMILKVPYIMDNREIFVLSNMKVMKIIDLAEVMIEDSNKNIKIVEKGIKPGEKLREILYTDEEIPYMVIKDNFFIIKNPIYSKPLTVREICNQENVELKLLTKSEIRELLYENLIL